jgi:hypothetical protein
MASPRSGNKPVHHCGALEGGPLRSGPMPVRDFRWQAKKVRNANRRLKVQVKAEESAAV